MHTGSYQKLSREQITRIFTSAQVFEGISNTKRRRIGSLKVKASHTWYKKLRPVITDFRKPAKKNIRGRC